jgi:hypothetical protein
MAWAREFGAQWSARLIVHHETRLEELRKALGRAQRAELIFGSAAEGRVATLSRGPLAACVATCRPACCGRFVRCVQRCW